MPSLSLTCCCEKKTLKTKKKEKTKKITCNSHKFLASLWQKGEHPK